MLSRTLCFRITMTAFILGGAPVVSAHEPPIPVSPGRGASVVRVESRCPTYSWSGVEEASAYEIVLYRFGQPLVYLTDDDMADYNPHINNQGHVVWQKITGEGCDDSNTVYVAGVAASA